MKRLLSILVSMLAFSLLYSQTATIKGVVKYKGRVPKARLISMKSDKTCDKLHGGKPIKDESFVVNSNGTLKWVLVYLKGVKGKYKPPKEPVVLDQNGCWYKPHVFGIMVGQKLVIKNSDPLLHNIHATPKKNRPFNFGQPIKGMTNVHVFKKPEVPVPFKCDVHPWMHAYAGVFTHPFFAVTDDKGEFVIKNVPPGTYTIEVWHEKLGTQSQKITVSAGETKTVEFTLERRRRRK